MHSNAFIIHYLLVLPFAHLIVCYISLYTSNCCLHQVVWLVSTFDVVLFFTLFHLIHIFTLLWPKSFELTCWVSLFCLNVSARRIAVDEPIVFQQWRVTWMCAKSISEVVFSSNSPRFYLKGTYHAKCTFWCLLYINVSPVSRGTLAESENKTLSLFLRTQISKKRGNNGADPDLRPIWRNIGNVDPRHYQKVAIRNNAVIWSVFTLASLTLRANLCWRACVWRSWK